MNLVDIFNQSQYIFFFLVVDNFLDIDLPQIKNFHSIYAFNDQKINKQQPYFCLEEQGVKLTEKNSGKLLSQPKVIDYIQSHSQEFKPVIIPFKPSAKIEFICRQYNWINASNFYKTSRFLEDKVKFSQFCDQNDLPIIPSAVDTFTESNFKKYQQLFGNKLVIQTHFGWAGQSTYSSQNWEDIKDKIEFDVLVKFSQFINGFSLLNNCCLTKQGLIQSPPALQYTGISPLTNNPFTTVGRQWPSMAQSNILEKVKNITQKFSDLIQKFNYLGFFGLDFLVDGDQVYLLECNPRLTASFAFYTQIEIKQNINPLFLFHLAQFVGLDLKFDINYEQKRFYNSHIIGSEITLKNSKGQTIKKHNDFIAFSDQPDPIVISQNIIDLLHEKK